MSMLSKYGFGMKLHTFYFKLCVLNAHDFINTAIGIFCPCRNFQTIWQAVFFNNQ